MQWVVHSKENANEYLLKGFVNNKKRPTHQVNKENSDLRNVTAQAVRNFGDNVPIDVNKTADKSTSEIKLSNNLKEYTDILNQNDSSTHEKSQHHGFVLIDTSILCDFLTRKLQCQKCNRPLKVSPS